MEGSNRALLAYDGRQCEPDSVANHFIHLRIFAFVSPPSTNRNARKNYAQKLFLT
jgi:hypothetical protein